MNFLNKQIELNSLYSAKYKKNSSILEKEVLRRMNMIKDLEQQHRNMKYEYEQIIDKKYAFKGDGDFRNYQEPEEIQKLSNQESLQVYKKKLDGNYSNM